MRKIIGSLLLIVSTWVQAVAIDLPEIYVTEVSIAGGGIYTVTINQPDLGGAQPWYLSAWGITNQDATSVDTLLTGWTGGLFDDTSWDSGITFEINTPSDPIFMFATGSGGIGDFNSVFGPGFSQAAVYWLSEYYGTGLVATSSNFTWSDGTGDSTAFAVISNSTSGENLGCEIGVGSSASLSCAPILTASVPIPAAAWLFSSGLLGLVGMARRKKA